MPGVEPGSQAWEACMMPLHYMRCAIAALTGVHGGVQAALPGSPVHMARGSEGH